MPAEPFTAHIDPDDLAKLNLAAGSAQRAQAGNRPRAAAAGAVHHGAHDDRQAARSRSERDRAGRAAGAASGRSYAFRRS